MRGVEWEVRRDERSRVGSEEGERSRVGSEEG